MRNYTKFNNVYACLSTYDNLLSKGNLIVYLIERFISSVVEPLNKEVKFTIEGKRMNPVEQTFNTKSWEKAKKGFIEGRVDEFSLYSINEDLGTKLQDKIDNNPDDSSIIEAEYPIILYFHTKSNNKLYGMASLIEFSVQLSQLNDTVKSNIQDTYIKLIEELLVEFESAGGFITIDNISHHFGQSPHEAFAGLAYRWASCDFDKYYRGYFWGNFLSKKHVDILGGVDAINRNAPVYIAKELPDGGMYLQLTNDINNVEDNQLRELKRYLKKLLPPVSRIVPAHDYKRMRIILD